MQTTTLVHDFVGQTTGLLRRSAVVAALVLTAHLSACSSRSDSSALQEKLTQAESKIKMLESELTQLKARVELPAAPAAVPDPAAATATAASAPPAEAPAEVPPIGQQWTYNVVEEQMTGGLRKLASVSSTNTVDFGFPYAGSQNGHLTLRIDPRYGKDVIFRIERGQVLCTSYDGCTVQVRFDDEKPTRFSATAPADHSSETVFIDDYARFLAKMRKAKRVRLSLDIYKNGRPVFDFDVSGFDSNKYQAKKS
jgi:outer membrane murein-binding lipoprotein Lpp